MSNKASSSYNSYQQASAPFVGSTSRVLSLPERIIMAAKRAFSVEYSGITNMEDIDENGQDQESARNGVVAMHDGAAFGGGRRFLGICGGIALLVCAAVVAGITVAYTGQQQKSSDEGSSQGWKLMPLDKSDAKTCRPEDAVMALRPTAYLEGLKHAAVASDHPICSKLGTSIMRDQGGNAIDAAVAVALCLGVANPASSGLGGGAFILIHADPVTPSAEFSLPELIDARTHSSTPSVSGKVTEVIDCREVAPSAATTDMYQDKPNLASTFGGLAVGVMGELRGLELAHARHGRLSWASVVRPAMEMASNGVVVNKNLAFEIAALAEIYTKYQSKVEFGLRSLLTKDDDWNHPLREGDIIRNPTLGRTLLAVMNDGADALYKGERAAQLARDIQAAGGIVTKKDIESYRAILRSPVVASDINGFGLVGVPPPSSGGAAILGAARFLAGYSSPPLAAFGDTLTAHRLVEACKHVFAIRMSLCDPAYFNSTVADAVRDLVEGSYIEELRRHTLDNTTLPLSQYGGSKWAQLDDIIGQKNVSDAQEGDRRRRLARRFGNLDDHGTSHFSIVDVDGNAVAMTTSVNTYFGSNVVSKSTGVILSNTMDDFSNPGKPNFFGLVPSEANFIKPGKKPLSSMAPTMMFRMGEDGSFGELVLVIGASGGPKIITAVLQVIVNLVMLGKPLYESIVYPRIHDQLMYHEASVATVEDAILEQGPEVRLSNRTRDALSRRGHTLLDVNYAGTVQAILVDLETDELCAGCDVRKGGTPDGY